MILVYFNDYEFEYKMKKFCNAIGCEEHTKKLLFFEAKFSIRSYYIFDRQELEEWFSCICRENKLICDYCDEGDCYTRERFRFMKNELHTVWYFVAIDWLWQPIQ